MFATSVVSLVTREVEENLSTLPKENPCTFLKRSLRKFLASPDEAFALVTPASPPQVRDAIAMAIRIAPKIKSSSSLIPALILFISVAVKKGITHSIRDSPTIRIKVIIVGFLNSLTDFKIRFIIIYLLSRRKNCQVPFSTRFEKSPLLQG